MKELKETEPLWAKRKGHPMDNCLKTGTKRQEEPLAAGREGGQQWGSAGICVGSSSVPCIHK